MKRDFIVILDAGGSNAQLVARMVRTAKVYCEVMPILTKPETIAQRGAKGVIVTGPDTDAVALEAELMALDMPILGLGWGARALNLSMGGETGAPVFRDELLDVPFDGHVLFEGANGGMRRVSRANSIKLPEALRATSSVNGVVMAFTNEDNRRMGLQFVPEQNDVDGIKALSNYVLKVCGLEANWTMRSFVEESIERIRETVGEGKALCAMSGGVDSSVCAALVNKAIGNKLFCIFVDTGLMRADEGDDVERVFVGGLGINLIRVDAKERFLNRLRGVTDPEEKRKIVGEEFIRVFEDEARKIGVVDYLVQGTIYPDIIESGIGGPMVKSHHNVGGLPTNIEFSELIEPLRELFKDEVRLVGEVLGLPAHIVYRQPFPGPGLAVRCIGEVTEEKLEILRAADRIFREEIEAAGHNKHIWQYFAVLTNMRSTGVEKNARSYGYTVALRAVHSVDAMTASIARLPYDLLERVVGRVTTEVAGVNRVVYDITGKPPGTIEWE